MENIQIINEPTSVPKRNNDDREQRESATSPNASLEDSVALVMLSRQQHAYDRLCELIPPAVPNEIALHPQWCNINSAFIGAMHWLTDLAGVMASPCLTLGVPSALNSFEGPR